MKGWTSVGLVAGIAAGFLIAGGGDISLAQMKKDDPVEHRIDLMKENSQANKKIAPLAKGKKVDPETAAAAARTIQANAKEFLTLFPSGTSSDELGGKTRAKPVIWAKMDQFKSAGMELVSAAERLEKAAEQNDMDAMKTAATDMGKACGGCHKQFRGPKPKG